MSPDVAHALSLLQAAGCTYEPTTREKGRLVHHEIPAPWCGVRAEWSYDRWQVDAWEITTSEEHTFTVEEPALVELARDTTRRRRTAVPATDGEQLTFGGGA